MKRRWSHPTHPQAVEIHALSAGSSPLVKCVRPLSLPAPQELQCSRGRAASRVRSRPRSLEELLLQLGATSLARSMGEGMYRSLPGPGLTLDSR